MKFSKFVVILCIVTVHVFTAAVLYFNWRGIEVQVDLIISFMSAIGVELIALAWVTAVKHKNTNTEGE